MSPGDPDVVHVQGVHPLQEHRGDVGGLLLRPGGTAVPGEEDDARRPHHPGGVTVHHAYLGQADVGDGRGRALAVPGEAAVLGAQDSAVAVRALPHHPAGEGVDGGHALEIDVGDLRRRALAFPGGAAVRGVEDGAVAGVVVPHRPTNVMLGSIRIYRLLGEQGRHPRRQDEKAQHHHQRQGQPGLGVRPGNRPTPSTGLGVTSDNGPATPRQHDALPSLPLNNRSSPANRLSHIETTPTA